MSGFRVDQQFEEDINRRLQEGNITFEELDRWTAELTSACLGDIEKTDARVIEPNIFFNLCKKLYCIYPVHQSKESGRVFELSKSTQESIKSSIRHTYLNSFLFQYGFIEANYDTQTRHNAWKIYKDIIISDKNTIGEGCNQIFKYLRDGIKNEKDTFLKNELQDMACYLISKCLDECIPKRTYGLFAIYTALSDEQIDANKCFKYADNLVKSHSYTENEARIMLSICDEVVAQSPILRNKALNTLKDIYHNANDKATIIRCENILYRIASKYPKLKENIENDILRKAVHKPKYDKLPNKEWIFIGKDKPCNEKIQNVYNEDVYIQIRGGLYTAPKEENGLSEWHNWLLKENWLDRIDKVFYVEPKENIKCLVIKSQEDANPYLIDRGIGDQTLDAKALAKDYDCVYIDNPRYFSKTAFWDYDVSSLIFLKPNTFTAYTEEEYAQHKALQQKMEKVRQMSNPQEISEQRASISNAHNSKNNTNYNNGFGGGR